MQAAVQVILPQLCYCADLCILQQNVKFHCSTGIKEELRFTVTSWKINSVVHFLTCQKTWEVNSKETLNLFQIKNNEN